MAELKVKVCGLKRLSDIALLTELGADYFGCILYPKSPRYLEVNCRAAFMQAAPSGRRVAVDVNFRYLICQRHPKMPQTPRTFINESR